MITPAHQALFDTLKCQGVLDFALNIPVGFEDYTLHDKLYLHRAQALHVKVLSTTKKPTMLLVKMQALNINQSINATIFHPKPYHFAQFKIGNELYIYGQPTTSQWGISINQPKVITKVGQVIALYKSNIRNDSHALLAKEYVTVDILSRLGLPKDIAQSVVDLHSPHHQAIDALDDKSLYALKFTECFYTMKQLQKRKVIHTAISMKPYDVRTWIESLPFTLTGDQQKAIKAIAKDLNSTQSAKRMIVGDVGAGKTMVILATAYMNQNQKSILMAPTALLALQLFEEAQKFLPQLKSILVTQSHYKNQDLNAYDFIIGTHALLYKELPNATVVMIDEQHRFGTKQRNLIEKLVSAHDRRPHVFQFSATPIPRTQAMVNSALLDVSLIQEVPFKKDITTSIIAKTDFKKLLVHIKEELAKKHQVLIIYPLVTESEAIAYQSLEEAQGYWLKHFEKVFVTHGKDKNKDQVLLDFRQDGNILLATTVVEVGISLPQLSTIVIVGAERLGFATLHQLRGRVSRTGLKGYCFLFTHTPQSKRLQEFSRVNSGFDIAKLDLKYRNGGDILHGTRQSGSAYRWFDEAEDEAIAQAVLKHINKE